MRPLALKYVKKCASKMDLKIFENLDKARKSNLLSHEFPAEAIFFQSISCLFKDFYLIDFDAKGIKLKLKNYSFLIPSLIQISLKLLQKWRRKKLHYLFMTLWASVEDIIKPSFKTHLSQMLSTISQLSPFFHKFAWSSHAKTEPFI